MISRLSFVLLALALSVALSIATEKECSVGISGNCAEQDALPITDLPAPLELPSKIRAIMHMNYTHLDAAADHLLTLFTDNTPILEFPHARQTFRHHLVGTFTILGAWGQPTDVKRAGLTHTIYSGDLFQFKMFNADSEEERENFRSYVGTESEQLTWHFGTVNRSALNETFVTRGVPLTDEGLRVANRITGSVQLSGRDIAKLMVVTIADYLDQMVTVNGWRDHHQVFSPLHLFPSDGRPELAFYWFSPMCRAVRHMLDVIPPIFNDCTDVISFEDERAARDAYWSVVRNEATLSPDEQLQRLQTAVQLNPFVAEPHILQAQLYFRRQAWGRAVAQCDAALSKMFTLASAWDKRLEFSTWLAYTRVLRLRAYRSAHGLSDLPLATDVADNGIAQVTSTGLPLVSVPDLVGQLEQPL